MFSFLVSTHVQHCFSDSTCQLSTGPSLLEKIKKISLVLCISEIYYHRLIMAEKYDMKSADEIDMEKLLESTDTEKIALDDVLGNYKNSIFELFNIIAHNIDQATQKRGFGEQIIKQSLVEFDRRIEKQKGNRD